VKRKDIKVGPVYAYYAGRLTTDTSYVRPVVVLSTDLYSVGGGFGPKGFLQLAREGRGMRSAHGYGSASVGLVGVMLNDPASADRARKVASIEKFSWMGAVPDEEDEGNDFGQYVLITSLTHLHGDYAEVKALQDENNRLRREEHARRIEQMNATHYRRNALMDRLHVLGVDAGSTSVLNGGNHIVFTLDEIEKLIDMAYARK
jgi:hypothetical protein